MERINRIINHPLYKKYLSQIHQWEENRIFCKHDMAHFLDVCRIAENEWLKYRLSVQKDADGNQKIHNDSMRELIYAAGLLHDIGRWQEYETGIRHEIASHELARIILEDCSFVCEEKEDILGAILDHRNKDVMEKNTLSGFIYRGDKRSRACFACEAEEECDWSKLKKNMKLL